MTSRRRLLRHISEIVVLVHVQLALASTALVAQRSINFHDRRAVVINSCPYIQLSDFMFENAWATPANRFHEELTWKNVGSQPVIAFEIVILKYDAFDRRLVGTHWTVTGRNSADWSPLEPGQTDSDGLYGANVEKVFTEIAYVRNARLADGTVWTVSDQDLLTRLRAAHVGFTMFGDLKPDSLPAPSR